MIFAVRVVASLTPSFTGSTSSRLEASEKPAPASVFAVTTIGSYVTATSPTW
jgi:hypothetical protein